jgi:ribose 5-phosphate isomerase B
VRIAFATDERTSVTDSLTEHLTESGHQVEVIGLGEPWPDCGRGVGDAVAAGRADAGIVMCWTGTGVSIAANKVPGVRAALCTDVETARGARRWNDANVLALGLRLTTATVAAEIADAFLAGETDPSEADTIALVEADWR